MWRIISFPTKLSILVAHAHHASVTLVQPCTSSPALFFIKRVRVVQVILIRDQSLLYSNRMDVRTAGEKVFRVAFPVCVLIVNMFGFAVAGSDEVKYAKAPDWVVAAPVPTGTAPHPGAPIRMEYLDYQLHLGPNGDEIFTASRMHILKPEALAAGTVTLSWSPDAGDATVHALKIHRNGKVINVLESTKFQILRREEYLESAVLNGRLTAVLQVPGLQVGDELEFAATVRRKDPTLGEHSFGFVQLPVAGIPGAFRIRMLWPESRSLNWRSSSDVHKLDETVQRKQKELVYDLRDPSAVILATGAPPRVNLRRAIQYSDFSSWQEVSARIWLLYEKASELSENSPIHQEITRIAESTEDPARRAESALRLVQERIRYVYVGLNGENLQPATIEETWTRRFGDCKAKTVLLMAILNELGIQAEPVMVDSYGGDGVNERLPSPGVFDHVLLRASIGGVVYWLDGTRLGDESLATLSPPIYKWVLPLRAGGADLEAVSPTIPPVPQRITVLEIDASGGFVVRAPVKAQLILRGDEAFAIRTQLSAMSAEDAERAIKSYWDQDNNWMETDTATWRYDNQQAVLLMSVIGTARLDWNKYDGDMYSLVIAGAGFNPPAEYHRPKEQDQTAPWVTEYPAYRCWATAIRLPEPTNNLKWDYRANPVQLKMGGVTYWRTSDLRDRVMRTVMSRRFDVPEISATEAQEVNRLLPEFDNNVSQVYEINADQRSKMHLRWPKPPFQNSTDWVSPLTPCGESSGEN